MKMIDALNLLAKGEIEENTKLIFSDVFEEFEYKYRKIYRTFVDENLDELDKQFTLDESFLNREVHLEQPSKQKYRIKLPYSELYIFLCKDEDDEIKIYTFEKDTPIIEIFIRAAEACRLKYKTEFTEKEFEEIEELKPYEQFKELVKDDENE
ncbi:hypothetical protein CIRMBP1257_00494 [Enterococcus cecorum]|nr:hypothetical protein CIRMBP1257_00494 [Enterococcus cecorum]